jgi:uncharacterized protein (DUF302 family)
MIRENKSKFNFEETEKKLISSIEKYNWKLTHTHNFQETMLKFSKIVRPIKVFEICNPEHAYKILQQNDERVVVSLMPCRIAIYEKENGITYVSRLNAGEMSKSFGGIIEEMMTQSGFENEQILKEIITE